MSVIRENACDGKVKFFSRKEARDARKRMRGQGKANGRDRLQAYDCPFCPWFHLGHISPSVARGTLDKDAWIGDTA